MGRGLAGNKSVTSGFSQPGVAPSLSDPAGADDGGTAGGSAATVAGRGVATSAGKHRPEVHVTNLAQEAGMEWEGPGGDTCNPRDGRPGSANSAPHVAHMSMV